MNILIPSPHCPIDCHHLWNFPHLPKHSGHHPDLGTSVSASCCFSHLCLAACSWKSPSPSPSTPSMLLSEWPFFFFFLHHELVCCIELYCCHIVNSFKLMEILPLHIKLPILYNRLFSMSKFIKSTISPHWILVGEMGYWGLPELSQGWKPKAGEWRATVRG